MHCLFGSAFLSSSIDTSSRLAQIHLATVQWIPFSLAYLHRYFSTAHSKDLKLASLFFALQVITSGHAGLFLIVAIVCLVLWRSLRREPVQMARVPHDLGFAGLACLGLAILLMVPYLVVRQEQAWVRTLDEARAWSPNAASFIESPAHAHRLLQSVLGWHTTRAKAALFPGVLPLLLAPFGIWAAFRARETRAGAGPYLLIVLASFGPSAGNGGAVCTGGTITLTASTVAASPIPSRAADRGRLRAQLGTWRAIAARWPA